LYTNPADELGEASTISSSGVGCGLERDDRDWNKEMKKSRGEKESVVWKALDVSRFFPLPLKSSGSEL
jgi:hypothetical protein